MIRIRETVRHLELEVDHDAAAQHVIEELRAWLYTQVEQAFRDAARSDGPIRPLILRIVLSGELPPIQP